MDILLCLNAWNLFCIFIGARPTSKLTQLLGDSDLILFIVVCVLVTAVCLLLGECTQIMMILPPGSALYPQYFSGYLAAFRSKAMPPSTDNSRLLHSSPISSMSFNSTQAQGQSFRYNGIFLFQILRFIKFF